jgi:hypothetical protein
VIPDKYPIKITYKKSRLLPAFVLDLYDLYIENGQAKPKQNSIIISKILIIYNNNNLHFL